MAAGREVWALADEEVGPVEVFEPVAWPGPIGLGLLALAALCLVGGTGCIGPGAPREVDGVYLDSELGYRIGHPGGREGGWKRMKVEGAELAFRQVAPEPGQRPALMILMSECGRGADNLWVVARQLLIGLGDRVLRQAAPMAHRGSPGWTQVFDTLHEGVTVRVKTVSIRNGDCTFDWALVAPGPFQDAEEQFDDWWASFERDQPPPAHSAASRLVLPQYAAARVAP